MRLVYFDSDAESDSGLLASIPGNARITEDGLDERMTEDGQERIVE